MYRTDPAKITAKEVGDFPKCLRSISVKIVCAECIEVYAI